MSFWDRFRRLYRETTPPASDYLSRLATIRRELDALVEEPGEYASGGRDLQACGPLMLVEVDGRERLATVERDERGSRTRGEILRTKLIAKRIADARELTRSPEAN